MIAPPTRVTAPRTQEDRAQSEDPQRFGLVLILIAATFTLQGVAGESPGVRAAGSVLIGATLVSAFWASAMPSRRFAWASGLVALVVVGGVLGALLGDSRAADGAGRLANAGLVAVAPPVLAVGVVRSLRRYGAVTLQAVLGGLCLYLLAGLFFASVYGGLSKLGGTPFFAHGAEATLAHCVYFSFTTLTTVGYGDLTARTDVGHTIAVTEALFGQLYLVTVISVGVANLVPRRRLER